MEKILWTTKSTTPSPIKHFFTLYNSNDETTSIHNYLIYYRVDDGNEGTFTSFRAQTLYGVGRNMETRYSLVGISFVV